MKTYPNRNPAQCNRVFEISGDVTISLIKNRSIIINDQPLPMKRYIKLIRCFNCDAFNHVAKKLYETMSLWMVW